MKKIDELRAKWFLLTGTMLGACIGVTGSFWTGSALMLFPQLRWVFFVIGVLSTLFFLVVLYLIWIKTLDEILELKSEKTKKKPKRRKSKKSP